MALDVEMVVDSGVGGEEALRRAWGSETAALSLATARCGSAPNSDPDWCLEKVDNQVGPLQGGWLSNILLA